MKLTLPAVAEIDGELIRLGDTEVDLPLDGLRLVDGELVAVVHIETEG